MKDFRRRNLKKLVEEAKNLGSYPGIDWGSSCWNLTPYEKRRAHDKRRLNLHFARLRVNRSCPYVALPPNLSDFAKAMIRTRASERLVSWDSQKAMVDALRRIFECLIVSGTSDLSNLSSIHFENALIQAQAEVSHNTLYKLGTLFEEIVGFINHYRLTELTISFKNPVRHPPQTDGTDKQSQEVGLRKMPSKTALVALADASNNPVDDNERIILRTIDLLVIGNFRIGEVLTLPAECWVQEVTSGKATKKTERSSGQLIRYGLRYWPEKGGEPIVKWLPDAAVPIAKRAVTDLISLCADARGAAKIVERNKGRVKLEGLASHECVDRKTLQKVFGLTYGGLRLFEQYCGLTVLNPGRGPTRNLYSVGDIETALTSRMCKLRTVAKPDGSYQMLSDSLCVVFSNQFKPKKPTYKFLPELLTYKQVSAALGNDTWAVSVFSRRGLKEPDGSRMRIRTHAFRHYSNTLADRGGLSDLELALWSGRRDVSQNAAYKHGTVEQRLQWARDMLRKGSLYGSISTTYAGINDPVEKETFLVTFVNAAHFTPYGVCVHDFAAEPCQYHLNCLAGCPEYLRTKGDLSERRELIQIKRFVTSELEKAEDAMTKGTFNANNWVNYNKRLQANTEAALAVDDEATSDGAIVPVFKQTGFQQSSRRRLADSQSGEVGY